MNCSFLGKQKTLSFGSYPDVMRVALVGTSA